MSRRLKPNVVVRKPSPNYSQRVSPVSLIVIHDTESHNRKGASDLEAIGNLFANSSFQASAHVCTDADGNSARYVRDEDKAWHCMAYNSAGLGIEQIGMASGGEYTTAEVKETARWVARWSIKYGIPIRQAIVSNGHVIRSGVITHQQLGAAGGGHSDPGPHYPMDKLRREAKAIKKRLRK